MSLRRSLSGLAGAALLVGATGAAAQTSFIANSFYAPSHPHSKYGYVEWAEMVEAISGGALVPEVYTGTVLLEPRANLQGIRDGVVQVAHHAAVYTPSELPVANAVQELGFNYADPLVAILAVTDFSTSNPTQLQEWADKGVVYLGAYATPPYLLFCREPVRTLEEMQGKRIRTAGSTVSRWVEEVGGVPVNVPSSEMYTGLERGTLDCASNAGNDLVDRSLHEVADHTTLAPTGMYWSGPHWGYNRDFWAGLSVEERGWLMEATAQAMARMVVNYIDAAESALAEAEAMGDHVYEPAADLQQSIEDFRERALTAVYETAETTYGLDDGREVIDDFRATYAEWEERVAGIDREDEAAVAALAMEHVYGTLDPATYGVD
jgi:TRAP-type C4-dicarboxylate transport system substrate-binding protein